MKNLFNLQLFADPNDYLQTTGSHTGTASVTVNTGGLSAEMKTFYDMTLLDEAQAALVHDQFGQKRPIPANGGKRIEFRKFKSLPKALVPLTEGVTPEGKNLSVETITAEVAQYGSYVTQTDILELTAIDNTILEATKALGRQAGLTLDTITRDIIVAQSGVAYATSLVSSTETAVSSRAGLNTNCQLKVKDIQKVVATLRSMNAPTFGGKYVAIAHPYVLYALMRDPEWIDAHKYAAPENLFQGEVGEISGVRFVQTTEAKIFRGDNLGTERALAVNGAVNANATTLNFDGDATVAAHDLKGKTIIISGVEYLVSDNTTTQITLTTTDAAYPVKFPAIDDNTAIYPGEGAGDGSSVYCTLFLGKDAYGITEISGGGLQTIVKQKGSAGTADPLDQRSSVGWKAIKTAEVLHPDYIVRVESCVADFADTSAN